MIINSQRTIYALEWETAHMIGAVYVPRPNTTLNEKFNIAVNESLGTDTVGGIKYLALGTGGHLVGSNTNSYSYSQHSPTDASLFEHLPFVIRPANNDLAGADKAKYRLRVPINVNGQPYIQYFLRVIDASDITVNTFIIATGSGNTASLTEFDTQSGSYLSPTPRPVDYVPGSSGGDNRFINRSIKLKFSLTPSELIEIESVIDILHGPGTTKPITELGVCSGYDKVVNGTTEVIKSQIFYHGGLNLDASLEYDSDVGFLRAIEIGGSEPCYL